VDHVAALDALESDDLTAVRRALDVARLACERRHQVLADVERALPTVPDDRPLDRETERRIAGLHDDIRAVRAGVGSLHGATHAALEQLRGRPGLVAWEALRQRLEERAARLEAEAAEVWPRRFRYTGPRHAAFVDGRYLRQGEVVELTRTQYAAWRDRFVPEEEQSAVAVE